MTPDVAPVLTLAHFAGKDQYGNYTYFVGLLPQGRAGEVATMIRVSPAGKGRFYGRREHTEVEIDQITAFAEQRANDFANTVTPVRMHLTHEMLDTIAEAVQHAEYQARLAANEPDEPADPSTDIPF